MSDRARAVERLALGALELDLASAPAGCLRFFELIFARAERVTTIRQLAAQLGLVTSTLMSRFFRNRLPAPKQYLAVARLVHAARLFENPGLSVANVANHLDYSSPQSFGRHVKMMTGYTASDFRQQYDGEGMFEWFRARLVTPYLEQLRRFDPIDPRGWAGRRLTVLAGGDASIAEAAAPIASQLSLTPSMHPRAVAE
jgi:AraC-like DNA-binding protein